MQSRSLVVALACFLFSSQVTTTQAALVFAINGQEGTVSAFNLNQGSPSTTFSVQVRRDDFDSGGSHLSSFGFRVRSSVPGIAQFTGITLTNPANLSGTTALASGATATAAGTYIAAQPVHFPAPGSYVNLASFTLTAVGAGSTAITIEELTVDSLSGGPNDFKLGAVDGPFVGQDRIGFSGDGTFIGTASINASAISVVPEPSSLLLACGGLALGYFRCRRPSKR